MRVITWYLIALVCVIIVQNSNAQEEKGSKTKIEVLEDAKEKVTLQEKEALKIG